MRIKKKCDKYYKSKDSKICVEKCQNGEYIHPGNICSNEACPKEAPFFIKETVDNIEIKKCVFSCDNNYIYATKECVESSTLTKILYGGFIETCPQGYKNDDGNKCKKPAECEGEKPFSLINEVENVNGYECLDSEAGCNDNRFLTSIGECVQKCPIGERFIKDGNKCSVKCDDDKKYKFKVDNGDYIVYECVDECTSQKEVNGKNECVDSCEENGLIEKNNICYYDCNSIESNLYEKIEKGKRVCVSGCGDLYYNNNNEDKVCGSECLFLSKKIINEGDKFCVNKCDTNTDYKFLQIKDNKLYCSTSCDQSSENKRYLEDDYKCIPKCPNTHYVNGGTGQCLPLDSCEKKIMKNGDEYFCEDNCSGELPGF